MDAKTRRRARIRRHTRVRIKVSGTAARPRLAVFRSNRHIYAQLIDDDARSDARVGFRRRCDGRRRQDRSAKAVGELLAERAKAAGIERVVFDRGGRLYHGRVAAVAEGAREKGLRI